METRFFKRDAFLIDEASFQEVMQEIMDDESLFIEYGYPALSLYSHKFGYCVEEDEIIPDGCNDWNDSIEDAMFDWEDNCL